METLDIECKRNLSSPKGMYYEVFTVTHNIMRGDTDRCRAEKAFLTIMQDTNSTLGNPYTLDEVNNHVSNGYIGTASNH